MSILVTGGTGKIGQHLVSILAGKGAHATVLVRDPAKVKAGGNVKAVKGDVTDLKGFAEAARGHERLFLLTNLQHLEPQLAQIARDAGVKHIVRISCWLADVGHENGSIFQQHGRVEGELEKLQNVSITTLRPADFMQNFLGYAGTVKDPHQRAFYHNASEARIASIDAYDIANSAAAVLLAPIEQHAGFTYTLTGPEAKTKAQVAEAASAALGHPVKAVPIGDAAVVKALSGMVGPRFAYLLANLNQHYRLVLSGHSWTVDNVELLTGQKPRSWEQFFQDNKAAFQ